MCRGDLSDAEWEPISPLLQSNGGAGRDLPSTTGVFSTAFFMCCGWAAPGGRAAARAPGIGGGKKVGGAEAISPELAD
jgi:hypothetical protein